MTRVSLSGEDYCNGIIKANSCIMSRKIIAVVWERALVDKDLPEVESEFKYSNNTLNFYVVLKYMWFHLLLSLLLISSGGSADILWSTRAVV